MSDEMMDKTEEAGRDFVNGVMADEIIFRLNELCEAPGVRAALEALIEVRTNVSEEVANHPTLQVTDNGTGSCQLGFLGALNGLVGVLPDGPRKGWGYITAVFDDETQKLLCFERTKNVAKGIITT
jgi:hypothetical protein